MTTLDGWEGDLGDEFGWVVIWARSRVDQDWDDYQMAEYLSDTWFPFGTYNDSEMLCFDLRRSDDAVFLIPYVGMSDGEALPKFESFEPMATAIAAAG